MQVRGGTPVSHFNTFRMLRDKVAHSNLSLTQIRDYMGMKRTGDKFGLQFSV
jgi:hypothetical protein